MKGLNMNEKRTEQITYFTFIGILIFACCFFVGAMAQNNNAFGFGQAPLAPNLVQWTASGTITRTLTPVSDVTQIDQSTRPYTAEVVLLQNLAGLAKGTLTVIATAGNPPMPVFGPAQTITPDLNVAAALKVAGVTVITSAPDETGAIKQLWP
jgi:hypothetical protein